jgi:hypothetical protein
MKNGYFIFIFRRFPGMIELASTFLFSDFNIRFPCCRETEFECSIFVWINSKFSECFRIEIQMLTSTFNLHAGYQSQYIVDSVASVMVCSYSAISCKKCSSSIGCAIHLSWVGHIIIRYCNGLKCYTKVVDVWTRYLVILVFIWESADRGKICSNTDFCIHIQAHVDELELYVFYTPNAVT